MDEKVSPPHCPVFLGPWTESLGSPLSSQYGHSRRSKAALETTWYNIFLLRWSNSSLAKFRILVQLKRRCQQFLIIPVPVLYLLVLRLGQPCTVIWKNSAELQRAMEWACLPTQSKQKLWFCLPLVWKGHQVVSDDRTLGWGCCQEPNRSISTLCEFTNDPSIWSFQLCVWA